MLELELCNFRLIMGLQGPLSSDNYEEIWNLELTLSDGKGGRESKEGREGGSAVVDNEGVKKELEIFVGGPGCGGYKELGSAGGKGGSMGCGWKEFCEETVDFFRRKRLKMGWGAVMESVNWCTVRQLADYGLQIREGNLTLFHIVCVRRLSLRR